MEEELLKLILVEMRGMKSEFSEVKDRLTRVEDRLTNVEDRLTNVEGRLSTLETEMVAVKIELKEVRELAEFNKETNESIMNVVTKHYREFKMFVKENNIDHERYNSKIQTYMVMEDEE